MILPFCRSVSSRLAVRGVYGMALTVVYEGRVYFVCGLILDRRTLMAKRCIYLRMLNQEEEFGVVDYDLIVS